MSATLLAAIAAPAAGRSLTSELQELADRLRRVTVRIATTGSRFDGVGAGIIWPSKGRAIVMTNAHVIPPRRGDQLVVEDEAGRRAEAHVIAREADLDLALLALDGAPNDFPAPASIGDARSLRPGEIVVAVGHPFGVGGALSLGIVHAAPGADDSWVRADVRLAPGNSGGPLATLDGAIVGINCMIARGLGIAVPAHVADRFAREVAAR
jgi:serine protease Do